MGKGKVVLQQLGETPEKRYQNFLEHARRIGEERKLCFDVWRRQFASAVAEQYATGDLQKDAHFADRIYGILNTLTKDQREAIKLACVSTDTCQSGKRRFIQKRGRSLRHRTRIEDLEQRYKKVIAELPLERRKLDVLAEILDSPLYAVRSFLFTHPPLAEQLIDGASIFPSGK